MRVRHFPQDSRMSRYWQLGDTFELCDDTGAVLVVWTGQQLLQLLGAEIVKSLGIIDMARALRDAGRDLYPRRRLLSQHKPLRHQENLPMLPARRHHRPKAGA